MSHDVHAPSESTVLLFNLIGLYLIFFVIIFFLWYCGDFLAG